MSLVAHPDGTKVLAIFQGLDRRANVLTATLGTCNFRDKRIINAGTTVSSRDGFDAVLQSGEVHLYWFGEEDRILNEIRSSDGVNFRNHRTLAAWGGQTGIAADSFGGRILVGGADNSDRHLWFVTINPNGGGIIQEKSFPSDKSALRPALSADSFQNFVYAGEDGRLNVLVGDGSNYNPPLIFPNQSRTGVGASHFNSKVVIAFTSIISGRIALHIRQGDVIQEQEFDQFTAHAPELLSIGGNLYIAWVGLDDHLNFALVEGI